MSVNAGVQASPSHEPSARISREKWVTLVTTAIVLIVALFMVALWIAEFTGIGPFKTFVALVALAIATIALSCLNALTVAMLPVADDLEGTGS